MMVVDATVATKWYLHESNSAKAVALLAVSQDPLYAPDWIHAEVVSAIIRRHRLGGIGRRAAEALISDWNRDLELGRIALEPWQSLLEDAAKLAHATHHALVDCLYLACAVRLGAPLVTADAKLYRRGSVAYERVKLL